MRSRKWGQKSPQEEMYRVRLERLVDPKHPLVKLGERIDWAWFEEAYGGNFGETGRPALPTRLVISLCILKHMENLSDEEVVVRWVENPYWQHFSGAEFFEHRLPCNPSSLTRWRERLGEEGAKRILSESLRVAVDDGQLKLKSMSEVVVDTTVQPKDITHPTDAKLLESARKALVKAAVGVNIRLRRSYSRAGKEAVFRSARYRHARQMKRAKKQDRRLRVMLGAVMRDVRRKSDQMGLAMEGALLAALTTAQRIFHQVLDPKSKNKVYSVHEPETACIAKGKSHKPFEFGSKVSVATTVKDSWVVGVEDFSGNPYDGSTLRKAVDGIRSVTGGEVARVFVDKGYRGTKHHPEGVQVIISDRKNLKPELHRKLKRRQSIEPVLGHLKSDHRLDRNFLKGKLGDILNAVLAAVGFNFRKLMRPWRQAWLSFVFVWLATLALRALFPQLMAPPLTST